MKKTTAFILSVNLAFPFWTAAPAGAIKSDILNKLAEKLSGSQDRSGSNLGSIFDNSQQVAAKLTVSPSSYLLPSPKPMTQAQLKKTMIENLDTIQGIFAAQYGPGIYKEAHEGWDLDRSIAKAKRQVRQSPQITIEKYHDILRQFFSSMKDYHVGVMFDATGSSTLPFSVVGVGSRYFISWIDRNKLPESSFPFHVGDEVVSFGGKPTAQAVRKIAALGMDNAARTDKAIAAMRLTSRKAASFGGVTDGQVTISIKPKGSDKIFRRPLMWDYNPEAVPEPLMRQANVKPVSTLPDAWMGGMLSPVAAELSGPQADNPYSLGHQAGFLPPFGKTIWQSGKEAEFRAYIYKTPDGRSIGCVRIPSYEPGDPDTAVAEFAALIKRFESSTDALVIDQLNNPGGSILYSYALASMLSDQPLKTPRHRIAVTKDDALAAAEFLKTEPLVKGASSPNDAAQQAFGGATIAGYPVDYEMYKHMAAFSRYILGQVKQGRTLTDPPIYVEGVDQITPSAMASYTKPIVLLINELDFSGGDFFPAIMQDNHRAVLFGTRTAGAGGFVRDVPFPPNQVGVMGFTMTGSLAIRADHMPIENLGVTPDVPYAISAADYQNNFKGYVEAVNAEVLKLIGPKK